MRLKHFLKAIVLGSKIPRRSSIGYCAHNELLPAVLIKTPTEKLRKLFSLPKHDHVTQLNQDFFALITNRFVAGFFVDIGANDGFTISNTVYLEQCFGWTGILVEANPRYVESLKRRSAAVANVAVASEEGMLKFCDAGLYGGLYATIDDAHSEHTAISKLINVRGALLENILKENDAPSSINYISVDVEGGELSIVEQMCQLKDHRFMCGTIEHNFRKADYKKMVYLLSGSGYKIVWEGQTQQDLFFIDEKNTPGG